MEIFRRSLVRSHRAVVEHLAQMMFVVYETHVSILDRLQIVGQASGHLRFVGARVEALKQTLFGYLVGLFVRAGRIDFEQRAHAGPLVRIVADERRGVGDCLANLFSDHIGMIR